jgi:hypothetical protein
MGSPLPEGRAEDPLIEGLGRLLTIEHRSMPAAARLDLRMIDDHVVGGVLYLDPDASDIDRERVLVETLAALLHGPDAAATAKRARHLYAV